MGIYDRPYYGDEQQRPFSMSGQRSMTVTLIMVNVAIFLLDMFTPEVDHHSRLLSSFMSADPGVLAHPWEYWKLLTYGFAHAPISSDAFIFHIGFNMYFLWLFGRDVESVYGSREFLVVYLALVILAGLAWVVIQSLTGAVQTSVVGASGAVTGILILYVLHFPHRKFFILFIPVPVSAWVLGLFYVGMDVLGALGGPGRENTAYVCHLAGAAFAGIYHQTGIRLQGLVPSAASFKKLSVKPRLRVHNPERRSSAVDQQADAILEKLHQDGADSLTPKERKILEEYSRRMRQKHR